MRLTTNMQIETQKIKKILLVFFLVTVFGVSASIFAEENSLGTDNIFLDSDQDGLSDTEEITYGTDPKNPDTDGDGYSDGAEVKSGYDPLKPAPGDKISDNVSKTDIQLELSGSSENNLTEEVSAKLAALVSSGEAAPGEVLVTDIDSIVEESISNGVVSDDIPEINESEIKIKDQSYPDLSEEKRAQKIKEDEEEYTSTILYIMSNNLPYNISEEYGFMSLYQEISRKVKDVLMSPDGVGYFEDLSKKGETIMEQMKEIEVPESMLNYHKEALQIAKYAISLRDTVEIDMSDPMGSLVSLSGVESLMVMTSDFIEKLENERDDYQDETLTSENISTDLSSNTETDANPDNSDSSDENSENTTTE